MQPPDPKHGDAAPILEAIHEDLLKQNALLADIHAAQLRRQFATVKVIERKWLTVAEVAEYCGMSEKWVRALRASAPRGLFQKVKGTIFVNKQILDRLFEGKLEWKES